VARAFQRELGAPYTEDAAELTRIARDHLRTKYRRADLGISGGNFLVAETGSVVICTNEGNGRLCTSAPRVHVVFVGIEKVIPRLEHLAVFLKLLARSATGQPLTVYNHVMTGPRRPDEHDGPEQMHIILVDNGRTGILREETRELLRCIRCGACLNACPVYRKIGGHAYGAVYSGPIGALITPLLRGMANYKDLPYASSLCGACYEACPVKIDIPRFLIQLRGKLVEDGRMRLLDRLIFRAWGVSLRSPLAYRVGGWLSRRMLRARGEGHLGADPYSARGWVTRGPGMIGQWTCQRDMPTPPPQGFRHWWREKEKGKS
jgi:L-lactate dehydrogenase complex protein LldF